jgi:glycosyltransferase involved in cell wall biosynthesis
MKKIIFFFEDNWAFGSIHAGLIKELYKNGIYANILDWRILYTTEEMAYIIDSYDYFVTSTGEIQILINYGVPLEKIVSVAHAAIDIFKANSIDIPTKTNYYSIHNSSVITPELKYLAQFSGCTKEVKIVRNGINFDYLYSKPSECLKTVGYSTSMRSTNFFGQDKKRGYIAEKCANLSNLNFNPIKDQTFLAIAGYYKTVDCVIQTAMEEACGLSMLEAAAAGRLCIGTNTGYIKYHPKAAIVLPIEEEEFIKQCVDTINYYKENNNEYINKCLEIQQYAKENYDWSVVINDWIELFN